MNRNTSGLVLQSGLRPTSPKPGSCGFCSDQGFRAGFVRWACSKTSQRRLALLNEVFWYGSNPHASAVPSQTVSPERRQFGYFPL
jgi:hypothetical protein